MDLKQRELNVATIERNEKCDIRGQSKLNRRLLGQDDVIYEGAQPGKREAAREIMAAHPVER